MIDRKYFSRQVALSDLGTRGQAKLAETTALVVGLGGTGCVASVLLALSGVGKLILVDRDIVTFENLHRQPVYSRNDMGKAKAEVCASFIENRAPSTKVEYEAQILDGSNAGELVRAADIALDCLDNLGGRQVLNRSCVEEGVPLVHTGALGWEGSVAVFKSPDTACLECLLPPGSADELARCEDVGVLGTTTSTIGSLGALEAIKLAADMTSPLIGKILVIDFLAAEQHTAIIAKRRACAACGDGQQEERESRLITLCGSGEYYWPKAFGPSEFPVIAKSLPDSVIVKKMGASVILARVDSSQIALFRGGGVLIRGVSSEKQARAMAAALLRRNPRLRSRGTARKNLKNRP
ncbi:MAG: HesA/MoeB/ThiF family protein [Thaumarchaeota archaeon]|nr:HesA/MoeB/ThiF family protein [Nitrososphaerota archaeon]